MNRELLSLLERAGITIEDEEYVNTSLGNLEILIDLVEERAYRRGVDAGFDSGYSTGTAQ